MPFRSSKQSIYDTSFYDISVKKTVHGVWPPVQSASWFLHVCTLFWLLFGNHVQELKDVKESRFKKVTMFQLSFDLKRTSSAIFLRCSLVFLLIVSKDFFGIFHEKSWRGQGEEIGATTEKVTWFWSFTIWGGKCLLGVFCFSISPGRCVDVFFSGVFFGAFFLLGDFVLRTKCRWIQKSRDVSEKLLGLCRGIICILIWATNCSKVNAPWYKISLKKSKNCKKQFC